MIRLVPLLLLVGCVQKPEVTGSWVSVTKPPIQIVYMNKDETITPEVVFGLVKQVEAHPYKNYKFNENIGITVDATSHQSSVLTNEVSIGKGE